MSNTIFAGIVAAFVSRLEESPSVSSNVLRAMPREIAEQHTNAVNVQFDGARPKESTIAGAPIDWISMISVELYAKSTAQTGDLAVDPLLKGVYERIAADPTLGGVVAYVGIPSIDAEYDSKGQKTGWIRMMYPVEHRTNNSTLD
ncbi:hypothetical protein [Noviherbaspirillum denitrificans]|uniref:Uncharacterized protein n=1 Tax=Noviherbaspirillum denitrificans TaxID=1968433 RepID=A0A254TAV8_9BURK|nr:hypothetical protein [Noviherbaspirillum denitrificans]OWW18412.1 hypothetical protein AYR66_01010 [Noviherbaspirillum denitrificans]OWW19376.1 hypothetical protein AYR66_07495 [Noviherbaspirillum denitrificans]